MICLGKITRPSHGGGAQQQESLCIVYEGLRGGTLRKVLIDGQLANELAGWLRLRTASATAKALEYLHDEMEASGSGCHRGITSASIYLTRALKSRLVCAGLSCLLDPLS